MIKVWVLMVFLNTQGSYSAAGGPTVVDNIANHAECERLGNYFVAHLNGPIDNKVFACAEVWKVKQ